jgi:hypothetical protein
MADPTLDDVRDLPVRLDQVFHLDNGHAMSIFESTTLPGPSWFSAKWTVTVEARGRALSPGPVLLHRDPVTNVCTSKLGHVTPTTVGEAIGAYEHVCVIAKPHHWLLPDWDVFYFRDNVVLCNT